MNPSRRPWPSPRSWDRRQALVRPAHDAFIHAMHITAMGSAAVALVGAVVVLLFLPGKNPAPAVGSAKSQRQTA